MALGKNCCFSLEGPILNNTVIRKSSKENDGREFVPSLLKQPKCRSEQMSLLLLNAKRIVASFGSHIACHFYSLEGLIY